MRQTFTIGTISKLKSRVNVPASTLQSHPPSSRTEFMEDDDLNGREDVIYILGEDEEEDLYGDRLPPCRYPPTHFSTPSEENAP
jgi:hypothetical protein